MKKNRTTAKPLPYLDTIETTQNGSFTSEPLINKAFNGKKSNSEYENDIEKYLNNNSDTIKSAEYYKILADNVAELLITNSSFLSDRAEKILECGTVVETLDDKIIYSNFCRQRICPMCQRRRSLKTAVNVRKMVDCLDDFNYKYLHLVLTVPNCAEDELSMTIDNLYKASSDFFKFKEVRNKFKGVIRCLEVTYNDRYRIDTENGNIGKCFHPHLHCLIAVGKSYGSGKNYLPKAVISGKWLEAANRYFLNNYDFLDTHIEAVKGDINRAVAEIAKYCVKPLDFSAPDDITVYVYEALQSALGGRRLVQLYGCFRDISRRLKIDIDDFTSELAQIDTDKIRRYNYNRLTRAYDELN